MSQKSTDTGFPSTVASCLHTRSQSESHTPQRLPSNASVSETTTDTGCPSSNTPDKIIIGMQLQGMHTLILGLNIFRIGLLLRSMHTLIMGLNLPKIGLPLQLMHTLIMGLNVLGKRPAATKYAHSDFEYIPGSRCEPNSDGEVQGKFSKGSLCRSLYLNSVSAYVESWRGS